MNAKFSVIIPAYNAHRFIVNALKCIKEQTYQDYEVLVIDNGSSDDTNDLARVFSKQNPNMYIKIITVPQNIGISGARNLGIEEAQYEFVSFLDVDDYWYPEKLERVNRAISKYPMVDVLCHWEKTVDCSSGEVIGENKYPEVSNNDAYMDMLLKGNKLSTSAVTVRRRIIKEIGGFDRRYISGEEDYDCWLRLADAGSNFLTIREFLGEYRLHGGNVSANQLKHTDAVKDMLAEHIAVMRRRKKYDKNIINNAETRIFARIAYTRGRIYSVARKRKEAIASYKASIHLYPFMLKTYLAMLLTMFRR